MNQEGRCYCCDQKGYTSSQYHKRDEIPKDEWAIVKVMQSRANQLKEACQNRCSSKILFILCTNIKSIGWANSHIVMNQKLNITNLSDSGSSTTLFCNNTYCKNQ